MPDLSPTQLRTIANKINARYSPPVATMTVAKYVSHEAMTEFIRALRELADETDA